MNKEIVLCIIPNRADNTGSTEGAHDHHIFCVAKTKKGNKGEKERVSKQKLLKGCHQGKNVTVLVIFRGVIVPWPLHFEIRFAGPAKPTINMCNTSPKAYLSEVRVGWYFLVRVVSYNNLVFQFFFLLFVWNL